jgi:hypothetical protein
LLGIGADLACETRADFPGAVRASFARIGFAEAGFAEAGFADRVDPEGLDGLADRVR